MYNTQMMDHTVQKIGDKSQDHWAISASIAALSSEKGELSPYNQANILQHKHLTVISYNQANIL